LFIFTLIVPVILIPLLRRIRTLGRL